MTGPFYVYIVISTDGDGKESIILVTSVEQTANDLVEALDDADTSCDYFYSVIKKPITR